MNKLTLVYNFVMTKKFLITKFDCIKFKLYETNVLFNTQKPQINGGRSKSLCVDSDLAHFFEAEAKLKVMFRDYLWIKKAT